MKLYLQRILKLLICLAIIYFSFVQIKKSHDEQEAALRETQLYEQKLSDIEDRKNQIIQSIINGQYQQALDLYDGLSLENDSEYEKAAKEFLPVRTYANALLKYEEKDYKNAFLTFKEVSKDSLPAELQEQYDDHYDLLYTEYRPFEIEEDYAFIAGFKSRNQEIITLLEQRNFQEAYNKTNEQVNTRYKGNVWGATKLIDKETADLFSTLYAYSYLMYYYYVNEDIEHANIYYDFVDLNYLPSTLVPEYTEVKEKVRLAYYIYMNSKTHKQYSSRRSKDSGCKADPYDVCDYSDPQEFYYWHEDDFYDYEDAEDYWRDNYKTN